MKKTIRQIHAPKNAVLVLFGLTLASSLAAQNGGAPPRGNTDEPNRILAEADSNSDRPQISPVRRIERGPLPEIESNDPRGDFRSFDGSANNETFAVMGSTFTWLNRWMPADYGDGLESMAGEERPGAREISNIVNAQQDLIPNSHATTDFLWQWGQFVDHDMDLTDGAEPAEPEPIPVPVGDPWFDPEATGEVTMSFNRSLYDHETGDDANTPRQQVNEITTWIDASNVYGSDGDRARALRTLDGSGRMKTSDDELLPFNVDGLSNAGGIGDQLFVAGDVRVLAGIIASDNPGMGGDEIYQRARKLVGAEMQTITYREYLPHLLGRDALRPYRGYQPDLDASGNEIIHGHLALRDAFFSPQVLVEEGGIEPMLRGLAAQQHQAIDPFLIDDVRNFLFGPPGAGSFQNTETSVRSPQRR